MLNTLLLSSSIVISSIIMSYTIYNVFNNKKQKSRKILCTSSNIYFITDIDNENKIILYNNNNEQIYPHLERNTMEIYFDRKENKENVLYFYLSNYKNKNIITIEDDFLYPLNEDKEINVLQVKNNKFYMLKNFIYGTEFTII